MSHQLLKDAEPMSSKGALMRASHVSSSCDHGEAEDSKMWIAAGSKSDTRIQYGQSPPIPHRQCPDACGLGTRDSRLSGRRASRPSYSSGAYHLQARNAPVEQAIRICGSQLLFFYAWQKAEGMGQLPGHGPADFKPWLVGLAEEKYRWHVNPFMHGHVESEIMDAALAKSRDYLRGLAPAV